MNLVDSFDGGEVHAGGVVRVVTFRSSSILQSGFVLILPSDSALSLAPASCISLCLILGLPIGVWALVTASGPDVRAAFCNRKA